MQSSTFYRWHYERLKFNTEHCQFLKFSKSRFNFQFAKFSEEPLQLSILEIIRRQIRLQTEPSILETIRRQIRLQTEPSIAEIIRRQVRLQTEHSILEKITRQIPPIPGASRLLKLF